MGKSRDTALILKKIKKMNVTITKLMIVKVKKQYYMVKIMNRAKR